MDMIYSHGGDAYWTRAYGVFRWGVLASSHGKYALFTRNLEFDLMRGLEDIHVLCVVDDFGNLVRVPE